MVHTSVRSSPPDPDALTPAARRILDAASQLFYDRGITAVGVDLVAERSGVTKRTLYDRFGSKDALVATYLLARDRRWRSAVERAVDAAGSARDRVTAPFDALLEWSPGSSRGCAFVNALAELPDPSHPAHAVAADQKRWLLDLLERLAREAGLADSRGLALTLTTLHEGALTLRGALPAVGAPAAAARAARALVDEAASVTGP
ncbi:TetR/AcrR family transcriptional regulator [Georgenia sp. Z1491]|uniref:TetR/AcrR family transcriptional regulator n=1 Tax=Georgenia sp. Z1491 TaxID=3416707 RepID=UPI003CF42F2C